MKLLIATSIFLLVVFFTPAIVSAHQIKLPYWGGSPNPLLSCAGTSCNFCELIHTLQHFIYFGITLVVFIFVPILLFWGGFMILIAGGSTERVTSGKRILTGTLVGFFLAVGSFLIITTFLWAVGAKTGGQGVAWPNIACSS